MTERSAFQRFLSELRRRHVPETAAIYMVAAWAAIQFADVVVPNLGWPEGIVTAVIVAAAVGLPVTLVLAWVFEWGPEGLHRTADEEARPGVGRTGAPARPTSGPWVTAIAVLVVGIASALAVAVVLGRGDGGEAGEGRETIEAPGASRSPGGRAARAEPEDEEGGGEVPGAVPRPPIPGIPDLPPGVLSPEFADSIAEWARSLSELERLDSVAELRDLGRRFRGGRGLLITRPSRWTVGDEAQPLALGDTLRIEGIARDTAGVVAVWVDGKVVAESEPESPEETLPFAAKVVGTGRDGIRSLTISVRTGDGRQIAEEYRIQQLPEG